MHNNGTLFQFFHFVALRGLVWEKTRGGSSGRPNRLSPRAVDTLSTRELACRSINRVVGVVKIKGPDNPTCHQLL